MSYRPPISAGLSEESVRAALEQADGSPTGAARLLGVGRGTVIYWIRTRKIEVRRVVMPAEDSAA